MTRRARLDQELIRRKLVPSESDANAVIESGRVLVAGATAMNPARLVGLDEAIQINKAQQPYVTRGGEKLAGVVERFAVGVSGRRCLDVGASGGGFTDCLLKLGAESVAALDVGYGLIHESLRSDVRVTLHERTNVRHVDIDQLGGLPFELITADLSFISLSVVADKIVNQLAARNSDLLLLIKPQFEATRAEASKNRGVIRDVAVWGRVLLSILSCYEKMGAGVKGVAPSPLPGAKGNVEFFAWMCVGDSSVAGITQLVSDATLLGGELVL